MREASVLCIVALLVSMAEPRPSTSEFGTTVISTETTEAIPSTEYVEVVTSIKYLYAEVAKTTDYTEPGTSTQHAATSTDYVEETSTEYAEKATSTDYAEAALSVHYDEGSTSMQFVETTTDKLDVITTEDSVVRNATDKKEEFAMDVTSATGDTKEISSTDSDEDTNVSEKETTTELSDVEPTAKNIDRIISTINIAVTDATEEVGMESTTEFSAVAFTSFDAEDVEETNSTRYAVVGATTGTTNVPGTVDGIEEGSTEVPVAVNNTTEDIAASTTDSIDLLRLKKHEPESEINSSMILPCFMANARRGITPFIARSYDFEAELESWTKKKLPTEIAFLNSDNSLHFEDLTKRPASTDSGLKVKEYGDKVSLYLFTRHGNSSGVKLSLNVRQILKAGFVPSHPTKVIAHGFWSNTNSTTVQLIKDAYLKIGYYNVIIVDWSPLVYGFYSSARDEAYGVGDYLGQFLRFLVYEELIDPRNLHLIGHSLGAHLVGFAGKRAHQDGWGVRRITGLDPALPYFTLTNQTGRLDRTDADIVDVIHTCVNFLGMTSPLGDIDFYPNEGTHFQPGCNLDVFGICSHGRSVDYFAESITEPSGFVGKFCDFERADSLVKADNCPGEPISVMGEWLEFHQPGRYVLRTAARPPYGVGIDILYPAYLYKRTRMMLLSAYPTTIVT